MEETLRIFISKFHPNKVVVVVVVIIMIMISIQANKTHKILWNFETQTDHLVLINKTKQNKKKNKKKTQLVIK